MPAAMPSTQLGRLCSSAFRLPCVIGGKSENIRANHAYGMRAGHYRLGKRLCSAATSGAAEQLGGAAINCLLACWRV
eukprot:6200994-Pleurochrysis_carterae.AAC.1